MSFYLDIKLPIGLRLKAGVRKSFNGLMKSLIMEILHDLEEGGTKHYSYFVKERISNNERKMLVAILHEIEKEHDYHLTVSTESKKDPDLVFNVKPFRRYES